MRMTARHLGLLLAAAGLLAWLVFPLPIWAQGVVSEQAPESVVAEESTPEPVGLEIAPPGIVFVEIRLSEERAVATDTAGREWLYDFTSDVWLEAAPGLEGGLPTEGRQPRQGMPIDLRATQRVEVKPMERSVTIGYDEYVEGDIVATGRVTIKGWVKGNVQSVDKRVLITETGQVDGDIEAPSVIVKEGGVVGGAVRETGGPLNVGEWTGAISVDAIVVVTALAFMLLFFGFLVLAVAPRQVERIADCIVHHRVRCYALGFLFILLLPAMVVLFTITLVGILLVPFVPLVYLAAIGMGFVAVDGMVGGWILRRTTGTAPGTQMRTALGTLLLALAWVVVIMLVGAENAFLLGVGYALLVATIIATSIPICMGIGAVILTRFGRRDYVSWREKRPGDNVPPAPAPPPLHEPPPVNAPWPPMPPTPPEDRDHPEDRPSQPS